MRSLSAFLGAALLVMSYTRHPVFAATVPYPRDIQFHGSRPVGKYSSASADLNVKSDEKVSELNLLSQIETAREVIDAYNAWDLNKILAYRTSGCQHQILPASMHRPAQDNDEYRKYLQNTMPLFSNFTVVVHQVVHDAGAHTCIIHASSTADTMNGPYANEYALFLTFTDDGKKVRKFSEFVDSGYSERFFATLEAAGTKEEA